MFNSGIDNDLLTVGLSFKTKGNELMFEYCPFCGGGQRRDKYTFYVSKSDGAYCCHRGKCSAKGSWFSLCQKLNIPYNKISNPIEMPVKVYDKPVAPKDKLSQKAINFIRSRKLTVDICNKWGITADSNGNIVFNYFENDDVVLTKTRLIDKKGFFASKNGKPIFYGMNLISNFNNLVICEGEFDALSISTVHDAVVSVPFGVNNTECFSLCWDWLQKFNNITIWTDNDDAGKKLEDYIINHVGIEKCTKVSTNYKDANEVLISEGKDEVKRLIDCSQPVDGIVFEFMADADIRLQEIENVKINIEKVDNKLRGFRMGELSIWTGSTGSGKSTFLTQVMIESIEQNFKVCLYSGEMNMSSVYRTMSKQLAGEHNLIKSRNGEFYYLDDDTFNKIKKHTGDKVCKCSNSSVYKDIHILKAFEYAYRRYNCRVFVVDNLMTVTYSNNSDKYEKQSEFVTKLKNFAVKFGVHIHLVAHPRKMDKDRITLRDISGSFDIVNKADCVLAVYRNPTVEHDNGIAVLKNREFGDVHDQDKVAGLYFCEASKRFVDDKVKFINRYSWEGEQASLQHLDWIKK